MACHPELLRELLSKYRIAFEEKMDWDHTTRVVHYSFDLANQYSQSNENFDGTNLSLTVIGAIFHDIGKLYVSDKSVFFKNKKLTKEEFEIVKEHPQKSSEFVKRIPFEKDYSIRLVDIVGSHHEKPDGTGYPKKLKSEEIPIESRIIRIADTFDALTSVNRKYKKSNSLEETFQELGDGAIDTMDLYFITILKSRYDTPSSVTRITYEKGQNNDGHFSLDRIFELFS